MCIYVDNYMYITTVMYLSMYHNCYVKMAWELCGDRVLATELLPGVPIYQVHTVITSLNL